MKRIDPSGGRAEVGIMALVGRDLYFRVSPKLWRAMGHYRLAVHTAAHIHQEMDFIQETE